MIVKSTFNLEEKREDLTKKAAAWGFSQDRIQWGGGISLVGHPPGSEVFLWKITPAQV